MGTSGSPCLWIHQKCAAPLTRETSAYYLALRRMLLCQVVTARLVFRFGPGPGAGAGGLHGTAARSGRALMSSLEFETRRNVSTGSGVDAMPRPLQCLHSCSHSQLHLTASSTSSTSSTPSTSSTSQRGH